MVSAVAAGSLAASWRRRCSRARATSIALIAVLAVLASGQLGGRSQAASPLDDRIVDATGESRFTFIRWELETAPNHWLELFAELIHGAPSCDLDEAVRRLDERRPAARPDRDAVPRTRP